MRSAKMLFVFICVEIFIPVSFVCAQEKKHKHPSEKFDLLVDTCADLIPVDKIRLQETSAENGGRAVFLPVVVGYAVNKGVQVAQKMITDRKNRYIAQYNFAKSDRYFYNELSVKSAYDPTAIRFRGFTIIRTLGHPHESDTQEDQGEDTVFYARFIVDSTDGKYLEIINNGFFRMRLDSIRLTRPKVVHPKDLKQVSLDLDIEFTSTYRADNGQMFTDASLGKFSLALRDVPLFGGDEESRHYYDSLNHKKPALTGTCFTVPRSLGFYRTKLGTLETAYGLGLYSVKAVIKETSKPKFIDKLIIITSDPTLAIGSSTLQKKMAAPASAASKTSTKK
jgi:hypothetical protein